MNKKIVTLILVVLISFCFLSIVVADNATNDGNATDDDTGDKNSTIDDDKTDDKDKTTDKNKTTDKDKPDDKSKKNYILLKEMGITLNLAMGLEDSFLIIQNHLHIQEMNTKVSLHQRLAIQIH